MDKKPKLNHRQTLFVAAFLKHGNAAQAAREAGYNPETSNQTGYNLMNRDRYPAVTDAIKAAQKKVMEEGEYNLKKAMAECEDAMNFAKETKNANALAKAVELRTKLNGLLVEKHDIKQVGFHVNVNGIDFSKRDNTPQLNGSVDVTASIVAAKDEEDDDGEDLF